LTSFEDCEDYLDWDLGTHGIYIHLTPPESGANGSSRRSRTLTATYLPDVAPAQGWSKEEAIESAIRKSGFEGKITQQLKEMGLRVRRYRSEKLSRNYEDWKRWREEQGKGQ
jgi:AMMECR1 domain-containing protein